ncbi:4-alpha-glucanotransferase [Clostridium botulinum]|nr:4-alpha-glucanotransferase [Clostridium botulinum]MCS4468698.1 4-alpha-glucanotransferase [Clostridium botulinum]
MVKEPKFNITINYPTPENEKAYEERVAKAVAKVLMDTLSIEQIDEVIREYKKEKIKSNNLCF